MPTIYPVALYCYDTRFITLRQEHRLKTFENKVGRKVFGSTRSRVNADKIKNDSEGLHSLLVSLNTAMNV